MSCPTCWCSAATPKCDLPLGDPAVSRRHAEIRREDGDRYRLVDLGSTHGTFVGGRPVGQLLLAHGDEITLGQTRFRFEHPQSARHTQPIAASPQGAASSTALWRPITETRFPTHDEVRDVSELRRQ